MCQFTTIARECSCLKEQIFFLRLNCSVSFKLVRILGTVAESRILKIEIMICRWEGTANFVTNRHNGVAIEGPSLTSPTIHYSRDVSERYQGAP